MEILIRPTGDVVTVYSEIFDLNVLGRPSIRRASHVEPDDAGRWWADLAAAAGPRLGPFEKRSHALVAEQRWLDEHLQDLPAATGHRSAEQNVG